MARALEEPALSMRSLHIDTGPSTRARLPQPHRDTRVVKGSHRAAIPRVVKGLAMPVLTLWFGTVSWAQKTILAIFRISEETSRESGLVSGIASTGAAAGIFLAVFALMLFSRLVM